MYSPAYAILFQYAITLRSLAPFESYSETQEVFALYRSAYTTYIVQN